MNLTVVEKAQFALHLFLLYILISGNYIGNLLSCSFQRVLNENMIYKHLLAFAIFYITISMSMEDEFNPLQHLVISFFSYVWFILTSKMKAYYIMAVLVVILIVYISNNIIKYYQKKHNSEKLKKINTIVHITGIVISFIITIIGVIVYYKLKRKEYSKSWSWKVFILGKPVCKNK